MERIERIGVSLEKELLSQFDKLIGKQGYQSRSEAIRDLIRQQLNAERLGNPAAKAVAAVCIVYDHHATKLTEKLIGLQHSHILEVISSHAPRSNSLLPSKVLKIYAMSQTITLVDFLIITK